MTSPIPLAAIDATARDVAFERETMNVGRRDEFVSEHGHHRSELRSGRVCE
jgi:hypothetical protein